jgi:hypothetical protein
MDPSEEKKPKTVAKKPTIVEPGKKATDNPELEEESEEGMFRELFLSYNLDRSKRPATLSFHSTVPAEYQILCLI